MFLAHLSKGSGSVSAATSPAVQPVPAVPVAKSNPVPVPSVRPSVPVVRVQPAATAESAVATIAPVQPVRIESVETVQPLRGTGRTGDFVHNTQVMDERFRNVSTGWTKRLHDPDDHSVMSFDDCLNHVSTLIGESSELMTTYSELRPIVDSAGRLAIEDSRSGRVFSVSDSALRQFAQKTEIGTTLPARLIQGDSQDIETLAIVARNGLRKIGEKPVLLRVKNDSTIRAFLSESYAIINHSWLIDTMRRLIPGGLVSHFRADQDGNNCWFNVLIPDSIRAESDSDYGGMLATGNGETGFNRLHTMPSIFRAICMNGCIWDREDGIAFVDQIHRGEVDLNMLASNIRDNLNRQIPLLNSGIDSMLATKRITSNGNANPLLIVGATLQQIDVSAITRPAADRILEAYHEQRTESGSVSAFDVIQGMTRAAREFSGSLQEIVERSAGAAMLWDSERWETVFRTADSLKEKQLKRIFQTSVA